MLLQFIEWFFWIVGFIWGLVVGLIESLVVEVCFLLCALFAGSAKLTAPLAGVLARAYDRLDGEEEGQKTLTAMFKRLLRARFEDFERRLASQTRPSAVKTLCDMGIIDDDRPSTPGAA